MSEALKELRDLMMGEKEKLASYEGAAGEREQTDCKRCAGNGEIVTDWDRYLGAPQPGDQGDEGTADCPDCDGIGKVDVEDAHPSPPPAADADADRVRIAVEALEPFAREADAAIALGGQQGGAWIDAKSRGDGRGDLWLALDANGKLFPGVFVNHRIPTDATLVQRILLPGDTTPARAEAQDEGAAGEREAMEAVMASVDPATWPGLSATHRAALGRFAKPQDYPSPTPAADADRVRIMREGWAAEMFDAGHTVCEDRWTDRHVTEERRDRYRRAVDRKVTKALAALKSEGK